MTDLDPFAEGERAARDNIPAEANPYSDCSDEHALWSHALWLAGHETIAGAIWKPARPKAASRSASGRS